MSKVKQARRRAGLSQTELAERAGVAPSTIVVAESGYRQPQGRTLRKLADALDVTVADLLEDEVEAETPPKAPARSELPEGSEAGRPSDEKPPPTVVNLPPQVVKASSPPIKAESKLVELVVWRSNRGELSPEEAAREIDQIYRPRAG